MVLLLAAAASSAILSKSDLGWFEGVAAAGWRMNGALEGLTVYRCS
jgi:hypothetical protein